MRADDTASHAPDDMIEVSVMVYEIPSSTDPNFPPGFYYDLKDPAEPEKQHEARLDGPYPSEEAALDAAKQFINDAMTDFTA